MTDAKPERPADAGVPEETPRDAEVESAHLLANDAKEKLAGRGFDDDQIQRWADAFIAEGGSGGTEAFIAWIEDQEGV